MQNYIIYRAYGNSHYLQECRYSLLKYLSVYNLKPPVNTTLVVYTDQPHLFEAFIPFFRDFQLQEVLDPSQPKTGFINHLSQTYQGNILYFDSDTYISQPVNPVFEIIKKGKICVHRVEDMAESRTAHHQKLKDFLSGRPVINDKKIAFMENQPLFSTDAVGFSHLHNFLLNDVSDLQQHLIQYLPANLAGQLALSHYLHPGSVYVLQDVIASYRDFPEFKDLLHLFFHRNEEESIPNLVKRVHHIDARTIKGEKDRYNQLPFLKKLLNKLTGKAWSIRQYQNKI